MSSETVDTISGGGRADWKDAIVLDGGTPKSSNLRWQWWILIPGCTLAGYVTHRFYRSYRPRRLPIFTPFRLPEIYLLFGTAMATIQHDLMEEAKACKDRDLLTIYLAGIRAEQEYGGTFPIGRELQNTYREVVTPDSDIQKYLRLLRYGEYQNLNVFGKLRWWDRHIWSDEITWNCWAMTLFRVPSTPEISVGAHDVDAAITHLANKSLVANERYGQPVLGAFILSIPIAMLARRLGRRALYLPLNGVQRLLMWSWIYIEWLASIREWENIKRIQDKQTIAQLFTHALGNFDDDIANHMRSWGFSE